MKYIYERKINYYETDKMGVVHHSNYLRYLEEARCYFLEAFEFPFNDFETSGITIPVVNVNCTYKVPVTYGDTLLITVFIKEYTGVKLVIGYDIKNKENEAVVMHAETKHCFTSLELKPINLKKVSPNFHEKYLNLLVKD